MNDQETRPCADLFSVWMPRFNVMIAAWLIVCCAGLGDDRVAIAERPNIILFIADDISDTDIGCYGSTTARTPNIDALAAAGRQFNNAYLTASSCSPSRSSIITGRYPHNNGQAAELHAPIPAHLPWFPQLLREAGYYTALVGKHHMTSAPPSPGQMPQPPAFDLIDSGRRPGNQGGHATWVQTLQDRPQNMPFFFWFAAYDAHRGWDGDQDWVEGLYGPQHAPEQVDLPVFLSDDPATRRDFASYHNEVTRFDYFVGQVVSELRSAGTLDNTLLIVMADNGAPFPRAKTRLHDSGMKTPLVIHWPAKLASPGEPCDSMVSAIDIAPTILEVAGCAPAPSMQGVSFVPLLQEPLAVTREYVFSEHNWHDYEAHGRAVRANGFLYIRNHRPQWAWQGPADSVASPSHQQLRQLRDADRLNPMQQDIFLAPRPEEELYEFTTDRNQLRNLAATPAYTAEKAKLRKLLNDWTEQTHDSAPVDLTPDTFDRETGKSILTQEQRRPSWRGMTPGMDRNAAYIDHPGPIRAANHSASDPSASGR